MDAITNQQIGNSNPSDYVGTFAACNNAFNELLHTHFIDLDGFGIQHDDFDLFLKARSEKMYAALLSRLVKLPDDNLNDIASESFAAEEYKCENTCTENSSDNDMPLVDALAVGKGAKKYALEYLKKQGVSLTKSVTYAAFQEDKNAYWANPHPKMLGKEWTIVLNNHVLRSLTIIKVPANTFSITNGSSSGLFMRGDDPNKVDLNIQVNTLCDRKSDLDFTPYVQQILDYSQSE